MEQWIKYHLVSIFARLVIFFFIFLALQPDTSRQYKMSELDSVAIEMSKSILARSIKNDEEWGGVIYVRNGKVLSNEPMTNGSKHSLTLGKLHSGRFVGYPIAVFHSHGAKSKGYNDEYFSKTDTSSNLHQYLITPSGKILKFNASSRKIFIREGTDWVLQFPSCEAHRDSLKEAGVL